MPEPLPDRLIQEAAAFIEAGWTIPTAAQLLGTTPATLRRRLRRNGITIPDGRTHSGGTNRRTWTHTQLEQAANLYESGAPIRAVARTLGTGCRQAAAALRQADVQLRPAAHIPRRTEPQ